MTGSRSGRRLSSAVCLVLTVWLVYAAHLTSNVARETYLALAMAERFTTQVDPYLGLHPDIFEIPGRGSYINSNPGASMLGAVPLLVSRPAVAALFAAKPALAAPKAPTTYDDPRPNRTTFMNEMRRRGLDIRLALAAFTTQVGLMAPLGALAALAVFHYLLGYWRDERAALAYALLYALGTPLFFRSAFLNQNALLAHAVLFSWMLLTARGAGPDAPQRDRDWAVVGALLGFGLVLDYSAAPLAVVFGGWAFVDGWTTGRLSGALRRAACCLAGALPMVALLLAYQHAAFGSPWFPAQRYMPPTEFSVRGWNGMTWPTVELLWRNLADARYGLLAFCPMLAFGILAPFARATMIPRTAVIVGLIAVVALWLFNSANQFANLQWNTGVRYMVPAVPLLFFLAVPLLRALPRLARWVVLAATVGVSWSVSMLREDVLTSIRLTLTEGPTLPMLIVLRKTASAYAPWLGGSAQPLGLLAVAALLATILLGWRLLWRGAPRSIPPLDPAVAA
jgi:hypothetical protein